MRVYLREGETMIQILELFGGIGSPRVALRNLGIPVKADEHRCSSSYISDYRGGGCLDLV